MMFKINPKNPQPRLVRKTTEILQRGGVIIYPTDTTYGIGCDLFNKKAVERVYRIKAAESDKPLSFICADLKDLSRYAVGVSNYAYQTMRRLFPGPYTFVLRASKMVPKIMRSRQKTVGIRIPDHAVALALVRELDNPVLSTSANFSGDEPINNPAEIQQLLGTQVDVILDCDVLPRVPSTVVSLVGDKVEVLRAGAGDASFFLELAAG
ncbi:MAG: threonylcarbamoyl-AMP synthase [Candidatus Latescibacteria bacterium]|nr:threonylcarbamoyl-AMP synthase [Candidatus Latescibacterota bacterium]